MVSRRNRVHGGSDAVYSLAVYNNELYAGGSFFGSVAKWNGTSWATVGTGGPNSGISSLVVFNNKLTAGSSSECFAWNGTTWSSMHTSNVYYDNLTVANGVLYCSSFNLNAFNSFAAQWNGSAWVAAGTGQTLSCLAIGTWNNNAIIGGNFTYVNNGTTSANHIAQWNGTTWSALGSGLSSSVKSMGTWNSELYAGVTGGVAKWNGSTWTALGTGISGTPVAINNYNNALYVGGVITTAGGIPVNNIAKWNGTTWDSLGSGLNSTVNCMVVFNNSLYVGGGFTMAGGNTANHVAKWNVAGAGIDEISNVTNISVYPNPASTILNIHHSTYTSQETLLITDLLGNEVYKEMLTGIDNSISISKWSNGVYFYEVRGETGSVRGKFVVQK